MVGTLCLDHLTPFLPHKKMFSLSKLQTNPLEIDAL